MNNQTNVADKDNNAENNPFTTETGHNLEDGQLEMNADQHSVESKQAIEEHETTGNEGQQESNDTSDDGIHTALPPKISSWNAINEQIDAKKEPITGYYDNTKNYDPGKYFYKDLAERFVQQQAQVINHRSSLLKWFAWITAMQLLAINVLIFLCVYANEQVLEILLDFMKFFVGATFLELMGGLLIIVNYVFGHEAYDMLKHLSHVDPSKEK